MISEVQHLLERYISWLRDRTVLREIDGWVEITTPYLDRHNDYLQIYIKKENNGFLLTDDGYVIDDLKLSGCNLDSRKRQDLLKMTLNGFGVQMEGDTLIVRASADNFAAKKHNLIQAMLAINDLFYLATPLVASVFIEDVSNWFELCDIRATPRVKFTGKSGYDHVFDFAIPKSREQPERIVRAISRPVRDNAEAVAFAWVDTREVRPENSRAYAFLNDTEHILPSAIIDALRSYDVKPVLWSQRELVREELAA